MANKGSEPGKEIRTSTPNAIGLPRKGTYMSTETQHEYKGKTYTRMGDIWLDRDRLLVSDLLAARLTMEVDGKPLSPPTPPAKATKAKSSKAKTTTVKAPKTPKTTKSKKKAEPEAEAAEE